ncbi:tetratricopeptide (TPR) repeat protein [Methylohalomonas lacus]|uniref:Tetratricopeptide (TPR) repeat protein n=1 Tax=Methylohalomonas lacus TaxID=398773 RepID=A0AAE3HLM5_9GAMM|nr:PA2778 family cysteine peptidase [Methylohalomonas lacus]MCS3903247.1 tetratricopeptide (TPR) repeat protein [Methylohalomonas lacus]
MRLKVTGGRATLRAASAAGLLLLLAACATPQYRAIEQQPGDLPPRASVDDVPFIAQEVLYCGPAALAMTLNWAGVDTSQAEVADQVYTPGRDGTLPSDLLSGARRNGVLAVKVASLRDLLAEIEAGHPVLVFQNLGLSFWPQWHFAVATGYDLEQDTLTLHSGTQADHVTDLNSFSRTWQRADNWAITVTPPDRLPQRADAAAILSGAAGLERAGHSSAARQAYQALSERWPENVTAWMGLGNTSYQLEQHDRAIESFRAALDIKPEYAPAWNNLAYSLLQVGQHEAAVAAARRAVEFAGDEAERYRQTLAEIETGTGN